MGAEECETFRAPFRRLRDRRTSVRTWSSASTAKGCCSLLAVFFALVAYLPRAAEARSYDFSYGEGAPQQRNWRITCYTCMNVSNNEECNRYAIDRPCPEGRDFCLTLHVMEGMETYRSVLVNKRCASLEDCVGDSTGCTAAYGQTQCVSCCDQPYCNDYVPSNDTEATFHRSTACGTIVSLGGVDTIWRFAAVLTPAMAVLTFAGPS